MKKKLKYIRDKNFIILFMGILVSGIGSRIFGFGIALFLLDLTGLASTVSMYVAIGTFIAYFFSPIAATFTDRWRNKVRVLYITDFGRGILYLIVGLLISVTISQGNNTLTLSVIYVSLFFIAILESFFAPASFALTPIIVERDELVSASSVMMLTRSLQSIVGIALGAFLYIKFGIITLIIVNGVSFILSGFSELFMNVTESEDFQIKNSIEENVPKRKKFFYYVNRVYQDLKESVIYIFKDSKAVASIVVITVVSLVFIEPFFTVGVPYLIKEYLTFETISPEYVLASGSSISTIGVLIMSVLLAIYISKKVKIYTLIKVSSYINVIILFGYLADVYLYDISLLDEVHFLIIFLIVNFANGLMIALFNAPIDAGLAKYIDSDKIGKVTTTMDSFGGLLLPFSLIISGYIIDNLDIYYILYAAAIGMVLNLVVVLFSKSLKDFH